MSIPAPVREYIICLKVIIIGERCELKALEERAGRQDSESVAMRYLFGGKEEILLRASIMTKHSAVNEDVVCGRLL